ncbi:MAG TPA: hypothetical protein VMO26_05285 [Vicinamibacterales bacterium]|nr:hypothetical protein [Vicinamibacterales bacterium]
MSRAAFIHLPARSRDTGVTGSLSRYRVPVLPPLPQVLAEVVFSRGDDGRINGFAPEILGMGGVGPEKWLDP